GRPSPAPSPRRGRGRTSSRPRPSSSARHTTRAAPSRVAPSGTSASRVRRRRTSTYRSGRAQSPPEHRIGRMDSRPIRGFDSGVGGPRVLHECLVTMPHEDFVYLGDHARLPYGPRPLPEIARFAREIAVFLEREGVKLIVVACNAATSAALPALQSSLTVPVVGVIAPEAAAPVRATRSRRIGLLAPQATVAAGRYEALVRTLDAGVRFSAVACPDLVPLIEAGAQTVDAVRGYAAPLKAAGCDTVILGCTHY